MTDHPAQEVAEKFGQRVHQARVARQMSQQQLADLLGSKQQYVSGVEQGRNLTLTTMKRIADALGLTLADMLR